MLFYCVAGNYGSKGMEAFKDGMKKSGVCIAASDSVGGNADNKTYDAVLDNLISTSNARVVICFCEGGTVRRLILAMKRKNLIGHFLIIGR